MTFSRDEAKQHQMRLEYQNKKVATDEIIFHNFEEYVEFYIGDVREANRGETYIPRMPLARVVDIAELLIGNRDIKMIQQVFVPERKSMKYLYRKRNVIERWNVGSIMLLNLFYRN